MFNKLRRLVSGANRGSVHQTPVATPLAAPMELDKTVDFVCNVCGNQNIGVPFKLVRAREDQSCGYCRSSLRMRSLMYALSMELFGKALVLPEFPINKTVSGLGMSDWDGYAKGL